MRAAASSIREFVFSIVSGEPAGFLPDQESVYELIEIAIQHAVDVADGKLGAVVLDQAIGRQNVASNLIAEVDFKLRVFEFTVFSALLLQLELVEPGAKLLHGAGPVFVLRPLILALYDNSGWDMREANRGFGPVHMLAAGAAGTKHVDLNILRLQIDFNVLVDLRINEHGGKGRVAARICVEWGDAHQPM